MTVLETSTCFPDKQKFCEHSESVYKAYKVRETCKKLLFVRWHKHNQAHTRISEFGRKADFALEIYKRKLLGIA